MATAICVVMTLISGWLVCGVLSIGVSKIVCRILHDSDVYEWDIRDIFLGVAALWVSCGGLALALVEWALDTHRSRRNTYDTNKSEGVSFALAGPLGLVVILLALPLIYKSRD